MGPPPHRRRRPSRMSLRPASVDPQGGPITGNGGGPMSLAKPAASWSHVTGKRHALLGMQATKGHSPPTRLYSTSATERPDMARRRATVAPAEPAPSPMTSKYFLMSDRDHLART